jgi:hypothetical protein
VPLAAATAVVLATQPSGWLRRIVVGTLLCAAMFKLVSLVDFAPNVTYFRSPIQTAWTLGRYIPDGKGLVASDPFTSYYLPAATGDQTLTVTKAHVGSQAELAASQSGYALLHTLVDGGNSAWWPAAQQMWQRGVRYVVVEKWTLLKARDLATFSTGPTPLIRSGHDVALAGRYYYRLNRISQLIADTDEYSIYRFDQAKLFPAPPAPLQNRFDLPKAR